MGRKSDTKRDPTWIPEGEGIHNEGWEDTTKFKPGIITRDPTEP